MKSLGATLKCGLQKVAQKVKDPPVMWETWIWSLVWKEPLEKDTGCLLQYSGLEKSMDYIVHGLTNSWTQLSNFHFQFSRVYPTHTARLNVASYFVAYDNEDKMD